MEGKPHGWFDTDGVDSVLNTANEVRELLAQVKGVGTAARGDVRVTVGMGGRLTGVVIGGRATELSGEALGAEIMAAASLAEQQAAREVHSIGTTYFAGIDAWEDWTNNDRLPDRP